LVVGPTAVSGVTLRMEEGANRAALVNKVLYGFWSYQNLPNAREVLRSSLARYR